MMVFLFLGNNQARTESAFTSADIGSSLFKKESSLRTFGVFNADATNTSILVEIKGLKKVCRGEKVVLTAQVLGPDTAKYQYQWLMEGQYLPFSTQQITIQTDTLNLMTPITVRVSGDGCDPSTSPVFYLTVEDNPITKLTATPICGIEGNTTLTATTYPTTFEPYKWVWYNGTDTTSANAFDTTYVNERIMENVAAGDHFTVKVLYKQDCCTSIAKDYVTIETINANPLTQINLSVTDTTICQGGLFNIEVLNAYVNVADYGDPTYKWYLNNKLMLGYSDSIFTFAPNALLGVQTDNVIKVVVSYQNNTCEIVEASANVRVLSNPSVAISGSAIYCNGADVKLTANLNDSIAGVTYTYTYEWRLNNATVVGTGKEYTEKKDPSRTPYIYTVIATGGNGCSVESAPYTVYVSDTIDVLVTNVESVCIGNSVTFTAHVGGDMLLDKINYVWYDKNDDVVGYSRTLEVTPTTTGSNEYTVKVTDVLTGCVATGTGEVNVNEITTEKLAIAVAQTDICVGEQVTLTATGATVVNAEYVWTLNGVRVFGASDSVLIVKPIEGKNVYSVTLAEKECLTSNVDTITIIGHLQPTVVISGDPIICSDSTVKLTANVNDDSYAGTLKYQWRLNNVDIVGAISATYEKEYPRSNDPYIFTVEISNDANCKVISDEYYVYINANPTVEVTVDQNLVCAGETVTVTGHLGYYFYDKLAYKWYANDKLIDWATELSFDYVVDTNTVFKIEVEDVMASCFGAGTSQEVVVWDTLSPMVLKATTSLDIMCTGGQVTVSVENADGTPLDSTYNYVWKRNGTLMPLNTGSYFTESLEAVDGDTTKYVYSVSIDVKGCSHLVPVAMTDTVIVVKNPIITITGKHYVCGPESAGHTNVRLSAFVNGRPIPSGSDYMYKWYVNGVHLNATAFNNDVILQSAPIAHSPYIYTVELIGLSGCSSVSEPFEVWVKEKPEINITSNYDTICKGGTATLTANLKTYNEDYIDYQWYRSDYHDTTKIAGATSRELTVSLDETTTYYFRAEQSSSSCFGDNYFTVYVNDIPVVDSITIENNLSNICEGGQLTMKAHVTGGVTGKETYTWFRNGVEIIGANQDVYTESPVIVDGDITKFTYNVQVTQPVNGCQSELRSLVAKTVTVNPTPIIRIEGDQLVCAEVDSNVHLIAHVSNLNYDGTVSYQWFEDGNLIVGEVDSNLYLTKTFSERPYVYSVVVTNEYGCSVSYENINVSVNAAPIVVVTSNEDTICTNGIVTLTAHLNDWNADQLTFKWYQDSVEIAGATSLTYTTKSLSADTKFYFEAYQISSQCLGASDEITIKVVRVPVIASVTLDKEEICTGGQVTITATIDPLNPGVVGLPYTYTWYRNNVLIEGVTASTFVEAPFAIDGDNTVYVYSAKVTQNASACESEIVAANPLHIYDNPVVKIFGDQHICIADNDGNDIPIALYANVDTTSIAVSPFLTYTWYQDGQIRYNDEFGLGNSPFFMENYQFNDEPYKFTVEVDRGNGCKTMSPEFLVWVYEPIPSVDITPNKDIVLCTDGEVTLTANILDYNKEKLVVQWFYMDTVRFGAAVFPIENIIPGATQWQYTADLNDVTRQYGVRVTQTHSKCEVVGYKLIQVNERPYIDAITIQNHDTICDGQFVTLNAEVKGGVAGGEVYTWYIDGFKVEGATSSEFTHYPVAMNNKPTTYTYNVTVAQIPDGCYSDLVDTVAVNVVVYPNPSVEITGDPIICKDSVVRLVANINETIPSVGYSYQWRLFNADIEGETNNTLNKAYAKSDNPYIFSIEVTNERGCRSMSEDYYVYINDNPYVAVTVSDTLVCAGGEVTVTGHLGNGYYTPMSYKWYANGSLISWATELTFKIDVMEETVFKLVAMDDPATCSGTGYSDTVRIFDLPANAFVEAINVQTSSHRICDGGQVLVTAYMEKGRIDSSLTYIWTRNGFLLPEVTTFQFIDAPQTVDGDTMKYVYIANVKLPGCEIPRYALASDSIIVTRNPIISIVGDEVVCEVERTVTNVNLMAYIDGENIAPDESKFIWYQDGARIMGNFTNTLRLNRNARHDAYVYTIEYIMPNGCTGISEAKVLYVREAPVVNITAEEDTICKGGSTVLTANLNNYNEENLVYQWYRTVEHPDNLIPGATTRFLRVNPDSDFTYYFKVLQTSSQCTASDDITVFVNDIPVVDSIRVDNNLDNICAGGQVTLRAYVSGGVTGNEVYTWIKNGTMISQTNGPVFTETLDAIDNDVTDYTYNVIVTQPVNGCSSILNITNATTIRVKPNVTIGIEGDQIVCTEATDNVRLIAHISPLATESNGTFNYQWFEDNKALATATTNTLTLTRNYREYPYNFKVEVTNEYGCSAMYDNIYVSVAAAPVVNITVSENEICAGGKVTLTAHLNDWTTSDMKYQWYQNGTLIPGATSLTYTTGAINDSTNFHFVASQISSGCVGTSALMYVNTHPVPQIANITTTETQVCTGGQVTVTANIDADNAGVPGMPYIFTWYRNGKLMNGVTSESFTESPAAIDGDNTVYVYSATVRQELIACTSDKVYSAEVHVYDNPVVMISGDQHICVTDSVFLMANVDTTSRPVGILHYEWYESGQPRDNMTNNLGDNQFFSEYFYANEEPYKFQVKVTRENGCTTLSPIFEVMVYPEVVVNITADKSVVCTDGTVTLKANLNDYNAKNIIYQWFYVDSIAVPIYPAPGVVDTVYTKFEHILPGETSETYTTTMSASTVYGVRVTQTHSGCEDVDHFSVNVVDRPQIDSLVVISADTICEGAPITVRAYSSKGIAGNEIYTWFVNGFKVDGVTADEFTHYPTATPDGEAKTYTYNVIVTQSTECYSDLVESIAKTVVVYPNPTVTIAANSSLTYCAGGNVILTANVAPVKGNYTYTWYRDNVIVGSERTYTSMDTARETSYAYHVIVTNEVGCNVTSATTFVTSVAHPKVTVTVDNKTICEGGVATFTAHVEGGVENINGLGRFEFAWSNDDFATILGTEITYTASPAEVGTYNYSVRITSPYGCQTVATYTGLEVVAKPEVLITFAAGYDTKVCDGGSTRLVANVVGGLGETSYQWYKNGVKLEGATYENYQTGALFAGVDNEFTVSVTQTGVNCTATSAKFVVPVVPTPIVNITGNENVCVGGTVTLTATVAGLIENDVPTYQWYRTENGGPANEILGATGSVYQTSPLTLDKTYSYYVVVTSKISGCTVQSATVQANVVPEPTVEIEGINTICVNQDLYLHAKVAGGVPGVDYTYTWKWRRNGVNETAITNVPDFVLQGLAATSTSPYFIDVTISRTDNTGCDAISTKEFKVNVKSAPVTNITVEPKTVVCVGGEFTFEANVKDVEGHTFTYEWFVDGVEHGSVKPTLTISDFTAGNHQVHVVATPQGVSGECVSISAPVTVTVVADPIVTIKSNVTEMCAGGEVELSVDNILIDNAVLTGDYTYKYNWINKKGETIGTLSKIVETLTVPGTYTYRLQVTLTDKAGNLYRACGSGLSEEVRIVVKEQPVIEIMQAVDGLLDICEGGEVHLTSEITNGTYVNPTYTWYKNSKPIAGENGVSLQTQLNTSGAYTFHVEVAVEGYNCTPKPIKSTPIVVNVNKAPRWTEISVTAESGADICVGNREEITLIATVEGGVRDDVESNNGVIQWYYIFENDTAAVNGLGGKSSFTPELPGIYTFFARYSGQIGSGCDALADGIPPMNKITVHTLPTASFTGGVNALLCGNSVDTLAEVEITFTGTPPFTFEISGMPVYKNIMENPYTVYLPATKTTTFRIISLSDAYCNVFASPTNGDIVSITVVVSEVIVPDFVVVDCETINDMNPRVSIPVQIASGHATHFSVEYVDNTYSYLNVANEGIVKELKDHSLNFGAPAIPGDYEVIIVIDNCSYSATIRVPVYNNEFEGTQLIDQRWDNTVVLNNRIPNHNILNIQWYKNGIKIEGANGLYFEEDGPLNGEYAVELTIRNTATNELLEITTCGKPYKTESIMKVYPVPAAVNQTVTVEVDLTPEQLDGAVLDIFDAKGAHVQRINTVLPVTKIDGFKAQGSYFGRIVTGTNEIKTVKFVIVK